MANTQSICTSFVGELLLGAHQFGTVVLTSRKGLVNPVKDTFKALLVKTSATVNATQTNVGTPGSGTPTTANIGTNEVSGLGYTAGGVEATNTVAPATTTTSVSTGTAYWTPSASFVYTGVTITVPFDTVVLYNATQKGKTVSVHTFTSQNVVIGTFTLTMPANTITTALLRFSTI